MQYLPYWSTGEFEGFGFAQAQPINPPGETGPYPKSYQFIDGRASFDLMEQIMNTPYNVKARGKVWIEPSKWSWLPWAEKGHYEDYTADQTTKLKVMTGFPQYFLSVKNRLDPLIHTLKRYEITAKNMNVDLGTTQFQYAKDTLAVLVDWYNKSMWGLGPSFPAYAYTCDKNVDPDTGKWDGTETCRKLDWTDALDILGATTGYVLLWRYFFPKRKVGLYLGTVGALADPTSLSIKQLFESEGAEAWNDPRTGALLMTSWTSDEPNPKQLIEWQELYSGNEIKLEGLRKTINALRSNLTGEAIEVVKKSEETTRFENKRTRRTVTAIGGIVATLGFASTFFPGAKR